jgi:soluble lytic murein transglycosylase
VNDFLRGQVDYYGGAYGPAVQALYRYIRAYPETHSGDAHWYAGLSYMEAGSPELAINEFQLLIDTHPESPRWGEAWLKLAELRANEGQTAAAVDTYRTFVDAAPGHALAAEALWEAGQVSERAGDPETAASAYLDCQSGYPTTERAPAALFRAGLQLYRLGDSAGAAEAWETLDDLYPESSYRTPALLWLGKRHLAEGETEPAATLLESAADAAPDAYYGLRAAQLASGSEPFAPPLGDEDASEPAGGKAETEAWLADWLGLESAEGIGELPPHLASDARFQRGTELWTVDRFQEAKTELEALRADTYTNPLDQYQLALAYADLGLYRSSLLSAWRLIGLSPVTNTLQAPRFLLELAYPTYYENLVLESAERTGLDPLLIFSLIRQESLFESLATSSASAHGLMQVIPPTGAEIAADLGWPPGYTTADLYRPYVSVRFGTHYLAKQRDRFGGRIDVALAAYNGGPFNAQRWLERAGEDRDLFLEQITFGETRLYVKRIQEHLAVYHALHAD